MLNNSFIDYLLLGWTLVAENKKCRGPEILKTTVQNVEDCASQCTGIASMFTVGKNIARSNRCKKDGCKCICHTSATDEGTCTTEHHEGCRLYKFSNHNLGYYYALL